MQPNLLNLSEIRVESFATEAPHRDPASAPEMILNMHTRWPKDCPETLPQFC
ncbi:MAG TPA: hypothetical protein VF092_23715 [Longimicrobium sp.]